MFQPISEQGADTRDMPPHGTKPSSRDGTTVFLTDTGHHSVRHPPQTEQAILSGWHHSVSFGYGTLPYSIRFKRNKLSYRDGISVFLSTASVLNRTGRPQESITTFLTDTGYPSVRYPPQTGQAVLRKTPQCFLLTPGAIPYGILFKRDKLSSQDGTTVFLTDTGHLVRYPFQTEQAVPGKASRRFLLTRAPFRTVSVPNGTGRPIGKVSQCFLQTPDAIPYGIRPKQNRPSPGKHHDVSY